MKKKLLFFVFVILVLVIYRDLIGSSVPFTHDGQLHLGRMANFYLAFKEGQLIPRWAPNLNNGFGYPVFNFNYPLYLYLTLPLIILNFSLQQSYIVYLLFLLVVGGWGVVRLVKSHFDNWLIGFMAGLIYITSNYIVSLVYVRGTIGELTALAILPWVLLAIKEHVFSEKISSIDNASLAIVMGAFFISHNISVLLSVPVLGVYLIWLWTKKGKHLFSLWQPILVALLLSLFFWIPALWEKQYTVLDNASLQAEYAKHFPTLTQLLFSKWQYGFSRPGPVDGMSFGLGLGSVLLCLWALLVWLRQKEQSRSFAMLLGSLLGLLLMALPVSKRVWGAVPVLSYVQFPWRLLMFWPMIVALIFGWLMKKYKKRMILLVGALMIFPALSQMSSFDKFSFADEYWLTYPHTGSLHDENMPMWFDKHEAYALDDEIFADEKVWVEDEDGEIDVSYWTGTKQVYSVEVGNESRVVQRTAYYPGWKVWVNGEEVGVDYEVEENKGLISFLIPSGENEVKVRFTQQAPARVVGNSLTIVGLLIIAYWCFRKKGCRFEPVEKSLS